MGAGLGASGWGQTGEQPLGLQKSGRKGRNKEYWIGENRQCVIEAVVESADCKEARTNAFKKKAVLNKE